MAFRQGFFDSTEIVETIDGYPQGDKAETADFFAKYFSAFIGNGVLKTPSTNFQVLASSGMTVQIRAGQAFLRGYTCFDTENTTKTFTTDTSEHTYHFVLRLDETDGSITRTWVTDAVAGTLPTRTSTVFDLVLAVITVPANATEITDEMITDLRANETFCGWVREISTTLDTVNTAIENHNENETAHAYIQNLISEITPTIDTAMSASSTNPVQNKTIKNYVDTAITQIPIDTAMSGESTNPVQNKIIKSYVDTEVSELKTDALVAYSSAFETNKKYTRTVSASTVTFILPTVSDATIDNNILVYVRFTVGCTVSWSSNCYFYNGEKPATVTSGYYDLIATYHPIVGKWSVALIPTKAV